MVVVWTRVLFVLCAMGWNSFCLDYPLRGKIINLAFCANLLRTTSAESVQVYNLPPVSSFFQAGFLHGGKAKDRIQAFLATEEVSRLINFVNTTDGMRVLSSLKKQATRFTPWLVKELSGIAQGSDTSVEHIWAVNLLSELQAAMPSGKELPDGHCSDVFARSNNGEVWHGHNEDWSLEFKPLLYFVVYNTHDATIFPPVGGLVYPGQAPGFAVTFTPTLWTTQNSLFPKGLNENGKCVISILREALVSAGNTTNTDDLAHQLAAKGQAYGMSTNVVTRSGIARRKLPIAFNVEVAGALNRSSVTTLPSLGSNMTHFNNYKFLHGVPVTTVRDPLL